MTNHSTGKTACKTRRSWLKAGAALALAGFTGRSAWAAIDRKASARELSFYNQHTGESLKTSYWTDGEYVPEALADINHILRDHRTNDVLLCPNSDPTCSVISLPTCIQRQTWRVEVR